MYKIGDFSKLSRISIRMLRHYEKIDLLKPDNIDGSTGYRYYKPEKLSLAARITMLKTMGFSLAMITEIINKYEDTNLLREYLQIKYIEVQQNAQEIAEKLTLLETMINHLRKENFIMKYDVNIKKMPQRYVASLRKVISSYNKEGILWQQMMSETSNQNLKMTNPCDSLAIFHDEGYKENDVDIEIQITLQGEYQNTENVIFKTVEPILVASTIHQGDYDQLTEANEAIASFITNNNYDFNGSMFCIYHIGPAFEPDSNKWITEICFPIKKK